MKSVVVVVKNKNSVSSPQFDFGLPHRQQDSQKAFELPQTPGKSLNFENPTGEVAQKFWSDFDQEFIDINCNEFEIDNMMNKPTEIYANSFHSVVNKNHVSGWIVDSGASLHMTYDKSLFTQLQLRNSGRIKIANGDFIPIKGFGSVRILFRTNCDTITLTLANVVYVPDLEVNLLPVNELNKENYSVLFEKST